MIKYQVQWNSWDGLHIVSYYVVKETEKSFSFLPEGSTVPIVRRKNHRPLYDSLLEARTAMVANAKAGMRAAAKKYQDATRALRDAELALGLLQLEEPT